MRILKFSVPEDKDTSRCRIPNHYFKNQNVLINQWVNLITETEVLYCRAWPFTKNEPSNLDPFVQAEDIIRREVFRNELKDLQIGGANVFISCDEFSVKVDRELQNSVYQLCGLAFRKDCTIRIDLGLRKIDVKVVETIPQNKDCIVDQLTQIEIYKVEKDSDIPNNTQYELENAMCNLSFSLPGLEEAFNLLFEAVSYPLLHYNLLQEMNIECLKGFLLYGPPGVGKTFLVSTIAQKCKIGMVKIDGPEVYGSNLGESEEKLTKKFEAARKVARLGNGCILFIDEIDALAPQRANTSQHESRVVAQLLVLMDNVLQEEAKLVIIAATNRPNSIDIALRRPGRFDKEIAIDPPSVDNRKKIIQQLSKKMRLENNFDFEVISVLTNGYVGADLVALCREATLLAMQRNKDEQTELCTTTNDFKNAMKAITPSLQRHALALTKELSNNLSWSNVGGLEEVKLKLKQMVEWPLKYKTTFERLGLTSPRGLLLVRNDMFIRSTFQRAREAFPSIIFFDEIDALVGKRSLDGGKGGISVSERILSTLLNEMDGIENSDGVLVVGATNRPDMIDAALMRPGRFDKVLFVPPPDEKSRLSILKIHTTGMALKDDVNLKYLAKNTVAYTGANLEGLCREAAMYALRESLNADVVEMRHFEMALLVTKPTLSEEALKSYKKIF
ncbi:hypothetical protein HK099_005954 [Clydaea vesicula]|uniref:AAA+ ATPase domain-containing protein n=1 Tax=Clydaea vesicula TaxID=447962 RepID=A0AAD5XY95_9FUNG|nr:hypothetical protein HK099_005954 [Clydaea vesicula]